MDVILFHKLVVNKNFFPGKVGKVSKSAASFAIKFSKKVTRIVILGVSSPIPIIY